MAARKKDRTYTVNPAEMPRMPRARRKGGQYIYPAGAYRQARIAPPASMPRVISTAPLTVLTPAEEKPVIGQTLTTAETASGTTIPVPRPLHRLWFAAGGVLVTAAVITALLPKGTQMQNAYMSKLQPLPQTRDSSAAAAGESGYSFRVYTDLETLRPPLEDYISELQGNWAVYLKDLKSGQVLSVNDRQMPSASLIKLFVAGCFLEQSEQGNLSAPERYESDLEAMISWSDNDAWVRLETAIGRGSYENGLQMVTAFAKEHGFEDTGRLIGGASIYSANAENYSSVSDVGRALEEINSGTYVSEKASETILGYMKNQHRTSKIPAGLPEGTECANKTGELKGVENDAAIIYGINTDYILVIMSNDNYKGTEPLTEISAMVFEALNPDAETAEEL